MQKQIISGTDKLKRSELIFVIAAAVVTITAVSTCSPLFPFNPWDDANCFFTVGRGITKGLVPYRDLYEQKGPLLYFIYALAALVSQKSFTGAWIIECIAASVFAVFSWKTVKLFTRPSRFAIALVPVLLGITYTLKLFNFGGNAEELCFPLISVALYFGIRSIVINNTLPSNTEALICGLITACLFWIKYTFVGFMIGFVILIIILALKNKEFKKLWSLIWRFLAGFLMLSAPILIYFTVTKSLNYLWEAYFYNNIFLYHSVSEVTGLASIPVLNHFIIPLTSVVTLSLHYPDFGIVLLLSVISTVFTGKEYRKRMLILFAVTLLFSLGLVFTKTSFIYYYGYILAYCFTFLLIPAVKGLSKLESLYKRNPGLISLLSSAFLAVIYFIVIINGKNMYLILQPKESLAQFRIAETIKQTPDAKILTYDVMDSGFYTASDLLPCNRFFCFLNIENNYPAILEEQNRLINEGYYDYVVTSHSCDLKWSNYVLVQEETCTYIDYTGEKCLDAYKLYKKI